jgi:hypothetical protein
VDSVDMVLLINNNSLLYIHYPPWIWDGWSGYRDSVSTISTGIHRSPVDVYPMQYQYLMVISTASTVFMSLASFSGARGLYTTIFGEEVNNMLPLSEPLPRSENRNLEKISEQIPLQRTKIVGWSHLSKEELQRRRAEGKRRAIPKAEYVKAILRQCLECFGVIPVRTDCEGHSLMDGTDCNLYPFNTAEKCRKATKTAIKRAIRKECAYCGGEEGTCGKCNLSIREEKAAL